ncbi:MAG: helix-turn-helix domain-containing protein [Nanoarchaeota archaeon]
MKEELGLLGFTDNEGKIYLSLLKHSSSSGTEIKRATGISNSRVYSALDSLIKKGFVTYVLTAKGKVFSAADPEVLKEIANERRKRVESIMPQLCDLQIKEKEITKSMIFEGFIGFKNAFYKMVKDCPTGKTIDIIGFSNQAYKNEQLRLLLSNVNTKSIKKKHKFRMILDNKDNVFFKDRKLEGISNIKFMDKGFVSPAAIDVFDDKVYIFLWDEEPFAFMIQNKNIANGFKSYFNFLWSMARG